MATLEKINSLKKEGMNETEIINRLRGEGISPMEINDALNQSKIKEAVSKDEEGGQNQNLQPSIMKIGEEPAPNPSQNQYTPQENYNQNSAKEMPEEQNYAPSPEPSYDMSYAPQTYMEDDPNSYSEDEYSGQEDYYQGYSNPSDTMIEIAEQVFLEKSKKLEKGIKELEEFKTIYKSKIEDVDERLKRMEKMFDKMQIAILDKVGDFGKNLNSIKKEMDMIEDSFSKVMKNK